MADTINIQKPSGCFEIQKVIGISTIHGNCKTYQVQWAPTWISGAHLIGCEDLIEQFQQDQKEKGNNLKIEETEPTPLQGTFEITAIVNNEKVLVQDDQLNNDMSINPQIKKEMPDDPFQTHKSGVGLKVSSLYSVIQQISERNDRNSATRRSLHPDFQQMKTDMEKGKDVEVVNKEEVHNNQAAPMIIVSEDSNCDLVENFPLQDVCETKVGELNKSFMNNEMKATNVAESSGSCRKKNWKNIYQCPTCFKSFADKQCFQKHQLTCIGNPVHHNEDVESDNFSGTSPEKEQRHTYLDNPTTTTTTYNYQCIVCYKTFESPERLRLHKLKMHSACTICKQKFSNMEKLKLHIEEHKTVKTDPLECSYCEKRFAIKAFLIQHERVHTGERPFQCNVCQKAFKRRHHLQDHLKRHEKTYTS